MCLASEHDATYGKMPVPCLFSVRKPMMVSINWFRFETRWLPLFTRPYPSILGRARTVLREDLLGWRALNKVINSPRGLDRYPTAPTSTRDGSHKGKTTANRWIWFYERDNVRAHVKDGTHGWESFGTFSHFVFGQWYRSLVEERRGYLEWELRCSGCFSQNSLRKARQSQKTARYPCGRRRLVQGTLFREWGLMFPCAAVGQSQQDQAHQAP